MYVWPTTHQISSENPVCIAASIPPLRQTGIVIRGVVGVVDVAGRGRKTDSPWHVLRNGMGPSKMPGACPFRACKGAVGLFYPKLRHT